MEPSNAFESKLVQILCATGVVMKTIESRFQMKWLI